jgi:prophage tail gpP-like protein
MPHEVELVAADRVVNRWQSYAVTADMYQAAGAFSLTVAAPDVEIAEGTLCRLRIDRQVVMSGVVEKISENTDKDKAQLEISGRDLMGLVVDEYCTTFTTYEGKTLRYVAERLLAPIPFISRKDLVFDAGAEKAAVAKPFSQVEPGATVFEVLRSIAGSRGLLFYCRPDGSLVFGKPLSAAEPLYRLTRRLDGAGNNIKSGGRTRDITKRWRTVTVVSQQQGEDDFDDASEINVQAVRTDNTHPLASKTMVVTHNDDSGSPANEAILILGKQRREGFSLGYVTNDHAQDGRLWTINEMCTVEDDDMHPPVRGKYLVYSRTFEKSKTGGTTTSVQLGLAGLAG